MPAFGVLCWTFAGFGRSPRNLPLAGSVTKAVDRVGLLCVVRPRYIGLMAPQRPALSLAGTGRALPNTYRWDHERTKPVTQRGERRRLPTRHYLLPYEAHAAAAMLRKQRDHPES